MIKADMLDAFSDEELREVKTLADKSLAKRDDERKSKAIDQARATLAAAGLSFKDVGRAKAKPAKGPLYNGGHTYQHPTNKTLVWAAKGKKPRWLVELESGGGHAVDLANDNPAAAVKRTD